ncbi:sodium:solute symporter family protein [Streptomyces sp. B-S-A8]|uniref:Sodium:solute symporter family protein n=1 Tax=Streptomyces solicavernae TaxID=3043614 RepID=A0ABT6RTL1_9ACTN|nr:sodium:solute symporter family protein [Streptomyces sp. B-S-A8]MDI3387770.1 sodium:solute symporter family protein [Streptomyces sp. B-S-A8]
MNTTMAVTLAGIIAIAAIGVSGRRTAGHGQDLGEWAVGGRRFGTVTMWFLQAGESFTTFSFLGLAGLAFSDGVAATYALGYLSLCLLGQYLTGPRLWRLGKANGYITQADFFADRFDSPLLGKVVAVVGAVFLLPYLQLQITGLGLIVQLATGSETGATGSMVLATVLTVGFVLWSGIRGIARAAYFKDVLMVVALIVLVVAVPLTISGGLGGLFETVRESRPALLTLDGAATDATWFTTAMLISAIGAGLNTMPHLWSAILSAGSARSLRRNYIWLPLYQVAIAVPVIVGFAGAMALAPDADSRAALLTMTGHALPGWLVGVVAVAAAATAMVPSAAILLGISTLVSRNLLPARSERATLRVNHVCVVLASALALVLGIARPGLLADLLLLTFGGLAQMAPATVAGLARHNRLGAVPALLGIVTGVLTLAWLTFGGVDIGTVDAGLLSLVPNIVVTVVAQLLLSSGLLGSRRLGAGSGSGRMVDCGDALADGTPADGGVAAPARATSGRGPTARD